MLMPLGYRNDPLERQPGAELKCAPRKLRTGDLPDRRASDAGVGNAEAGMVESVGRIKPELQLTLLPSRKPQRLAGGEVDIGIPRSTQDVPAGVAVFVLARRSECRRIEPLRSRLIGRIERHAGHHV